LVVAIRLPATTAATTGKAASMIGLREIRALAPEQIIWDGGKGAVAGFGARRRSGDAITYLLKYRAGGGRRGRQRWYVIGRHGSPWTPEEARQEARRILGAVATGGDPAADRQAERSAQTVAELCDLYLADAEAGRLLTKRKVAKKPSTLATDRGRIERHIKPLLGRMAVADVDRGDVDKFMHDVAAGKTAARVKTGLHGLARVEGGKGTATRTIGLLGAIFGYAVRHRMRPDNPCSLVVKFADNRRERRLSDEEYGALGAALRQAEAAIRGIEAGGQGPGYGMRRRMATIWPPALAAVRFIALTGWRLGEAVGLKWAEVDLARRTARLADTKTGVSVRPLSRAACDLLKSMPRIESDRVFPPTRGDAETVLNLKKFLPRIVKLGELPADITAHVFRHSFASVAADLGYSELAIAALLGHRGGSVTTRYTHHADSVLLAAADAVADRLTDLMGESKPVADVVPLRERA
jgi:integrase